MKGNSMVHEHIDNNALPYLIDIKPGLVEEAYFLVKNIKVNISKANKPYLTMLLTDKTGHLPGIFFGSVQEVKDITKQIKATDIVQISGILELYNEILQCRMIKIQKTNKQFSMSRFWKRTPFDRRILYKSLKNTINQIQHQSLKQLCSLFIEDKVFMKLFLEAPASRFIHHAYIGGLLEHTINVIKLVDAYAKIFHHINRDLVITGALLHDIGKVDEYSYLFDIHHSSEGKLKGHTLLGYERLQEKLNMVDMDSTIRLKLEHIILSHQGKRIWGAIEEPKFLEAYLVHAADSTDSSQFIFSNAKKTHKMSDEYYWSEYIHYINRDIYLR